APFNATYKPDPITGANTFRSRFFNKNFPLGAGSGWRLMVTNLDPTIDATVTSAELDITYASAPSFPFVSISLATLTASLASVNPNALLSDLNVTVNLVHPMLNEISIELRRLKVGVTNPLGAFDDDITLLHNRDDGMGNTNNMQGTS